MFKIVKKAVGMKPVEPGFKMDSATTPPTAPSSLPGSPGRTQSKQLSTGESLSVPPRPASTLDLASPVVAAQHTENRISLISPLDDNHAAMASPMEFHANHDEPDHDEPVAETSEYPLYDSPASFNTLDERMLHQMRDREEQDAARQRAGLPPLAPAVSAAAAVLSAVVEEPSSSTSSPHVTYSPPQPMTPRSGNGSLRPDAQAILKGSPRALGWQVDEDSEEKAWEFIMKDAVQGSVFDQPSTEEEEETHLFPHSKEELYRTWLKHWDEVNTSLVWRVVPSLKGIHQWILQPQILGEGSVLSTGVEMGTDTDDLPCHIHAEAEVQTESKTYTDVEVQTYEVEVPAGALMLLPEKPLKAPTQDFDLAQTVAPSQAPPSQSPPSQSPSQSPPSRSPPAERAASIISEAPSRSRSPFRRMIPSRKGSMASITSQAEPESKPKRSQSPFRRMIPSRKGSMASITSQAEPDSKPKRSQSPASESLKMLTSMRSIGRKGAPSGTLDNASVASVNAATDSSAQPRTQSGPTPITTPAKEEPASTTATATATTTETTTNTTTTTTPERPPLQSSNTQPASGRWGTAIRRANFALGWR